MKLHILQSAEEAAQAASVHAATLIRTAIEQRATARVVAATGNSQLAFLRLLIEQPDVDWARVVLFHLDEYLGVPPEHPASMQRYVRNRLAGPAGTGRTFLLDGTRPATWSRAAEALASAPADVTFTGIGVNGHLAFNEPPADFVTQEPFIVVNLAEQTRTRASMQKDFGAPLNVPTQAVTMSIRQILKSRSILCIATGSGKAEAARQCFTGVANPLCPASALQFHSDASVYLDLEAAALMDGEWEERASIPEPRADEGPPSPA